MVTVNGRGTYESGDYTPTQTGQYRWVVFYSGDSYFDESTSFCGSYDSTVSKAGASLSSSATGATIGSSISDTATLSGGQGATGTLTFQAYGPDDADCSGTAAFAPDPVSVNGNGEYGSGAFAPTQIGAYRWTVSYSGDENNAPATSNCNSANSTSTVAKDEPVVSLSSVSDATVGASISLEASLSSAYEPSGTITFEGYGPDDATCSDAPALAGSVPVDGNDDYGTNFGPTQAGSYHWIVSYSGDLANEPAATTCSSEASSVAKDTPSISTVASGANITEPISDTATITGGYLPAGSIVFKVYGPGDEDCSDPSVFSSTVTVDGAGEYGSGDYVPTTAGDYRWTADYSGDANNDPDSSPCNAQGETSTVAKAVTTIETNASSAGIGSPISDTAVISGGVNPGGTVTFRAYGPDDADCSGTPAFTGTVNVTGNGNYGSGDFVAGQAGVYRWTAGYSGDVNNELATSPCNAPDETSTVDTASPTIAASANDAVVGNPVSGTAVIAAGVEPGGTVTFKAFGAGDVGCSSAPVFTRTVAVDSNGEYGSGDFTPEAVGTYLWTVDYSGDGNNEPAATECGAGNSSSTVSKASPALETSVSGDVRLGDSISSDAVILSGHEPSGSIAFALYGPDDASCSAEPVFEDSVPVNGNGTVNSPAFSPVAIGEYRWVTAYSGDENNDPVPADCAEGKTVRVAQPTCPVVKLTAAPYTPAITKKGNQARGVRARIKVSRPSVLEISPRLS
ncbi:MAG: hypothetical protein M3Y23_03720, partial [Actinomycetota bacterium]|nr:hypothetical protein [Actinomycetota bacterium]